jgi:hypothetical protein
MSEISGIIRNSIERGWSAAEVRASLLNSGYDRQEIESELGAYSSPAQQAPVKPVVVQVPQVQPIVQPISQPVVPVQPVPQKIEKIQSTAQQFQEPQPKYNPQSLKNYQTPEVEKEASKAMVILIVILLILCVVAGVGLFLLS